MQYWKGAGSLWRGFQGYHYLQPSACILQVSAEQCGLSELVTDSLNGPEAPEGNLSQDVLGCSSGT